MYKTYNSTARILFSGIVICFLLFLPIFGINSIIKGNFNVSRCEGTFTKIIEFVEDNVTKLEEFTDMMLVRLYNSLDDISREVLKNSFQHFQAYFEGKECPQFPETMYIHHNQYLKELNNYKKWNISHYREEVFYYQHGLRNAPNYVKQYIKEKDIIDIGCYIGDSSLLLSTFTNKTVYAYDISKLIFTQFNITMKYNPNNHGPIVGINKGIGKEKSVIKFKDTGRGSGNIFNSGEPDTEIEISTIDDEVKRLGIKPGFIKIHAEGSAYDALIGANNTIKTCRPVIEIASHHNYDEYVMIPFYIQQLKDYSLTFIQERFDHSSMGSFSTFAYPNELNPDLSY